MKKLLVAVLILSIVNLYLLIIIYSGISLAVSDISFYNKCDTVINKVRIDSIEYVIRSKDSVINKIRINEKKYINKANELNDTSAVELFKRLVSE